MSINSKFAFTVESLQYGIPVKSHSMLRNPLRFLIPWFEYVDFIISFFRTKSCVSFPPVILQCAMTITPTLWTIYSRIIGQFYNWQKFRLNSFDLGDTFLFIPNALGIILGSFQLALRCVYPSHEVQYKELVWLYYCKYLSLSDSVFKTS